jgi:hypothetical protein
LGQTKKDQRDRDMDRPGLRRGRVVAENDLIVVFWDIERRPFRVDLDHRAVRVAARCHEGALQRPQMFAEILSLIARLRAPPAPA